MGCSCSNNAEVAPLELSSSEQLSSSGASTVSLNSNEKDLSTEKKPLPARYILEPSKCPFMAGSVTMTNLTNDEETSHQVGKLAGHTLYGTGCQNNQCHAAMMNKFNSPKTDSNRSKEQILAEASEFLREFYRDCHPRGLDGLSERLEAVQQSIQAKGCYFHTYDELTYGVKLCWRNSSRCIMRGQWRNISVIDARGPNPEYAKQITNAEIFDRCVEHLRTAMTTDNGGSRVIKSLMTVFPQLLPGEPVGCRIWNNLLIRFAGYRQPDGSILGDPANVDFTDVCLQMGWKGPVERTPFDVLPLIVQAANNSPPYLKAIPEDAAHLVKIQHPEYPKLSELDLKWYVVPALSNLTCDIGGIQYTCAPFNGWFMSTEIACRNLCDVQRYNLISTIAEAMGLDAVGNRRDLVPDRVLVEMNAAVLSSFDRDQITIVDHHTASDSFIRHYNKEMETRGFIAADWVWVVPPIGGSLNQVFHQEMVNFFIKPNFIPPSHTAKELLESSARRGLLDVDVNNNEARRGSTVLGVVNHGMTGSESQTTEQRQAVYIYYGSETGVSESNARTIKNFIDSSGGTRCRVEQFAALNECDLLRISTGLQEERNVPQTDAISSKLLIIVTSTFGSGGPPRNASVLYSRLHDGTYDDTSIDLTGINVAIFGNGNSTYADFNKCARTLESKLRALRATVVVSGFADERYDPEGSFQSWFSQMLSHTLCDTGKLATNGGKKVFKFKEQAYVVRFHNENLNIHCAPETVPRGQCSLISRSDLVTDATREVCRFEFDMGKDVQIEDGDHVAVLPRNNAQAVIEIMSLLKLETDVNKYVEVTPENADIGHGDSKVPSFLRGMFTLGEVLSDFIDLSAPPTYSLIQKVSAIALLGTNDRITLKYLALSVENFTKWVSDRSPSLIDFFREFPSVSRCLQLSVFLMNAPRIAPRLYSLSSSSVKDTNVSLTVRIDSIQSQKGGNVVMRRGLCSDYLWNLKVGDSDVRMYVSPSHDFHLVKDVPVIMICNGTGIAPFRSFWRTLADSNGRVSADAALFYYGCRTKEDNIYADELTATFVNKNIAIAYSRDSSSAVKYVTDLVSRDASRLTEYINVRRAKVYVCGTKVMATDVRERISAFLGATKLKHLLETQRYVEEFFK